MLNYLFRLFVAAIVASAVPGPGYVALYMIETAAKSRNTDNPPTNAQPKAMQQSKIVSKKKHASYYTEVAVVLLALPTMLVGYGLVLLIVFTFLSVLL